MLLDWTEKNEVGIQLVMVNFILDLNEKNEVETELVMVKIC